MIIPHKRKALKNPKDYNRPFKQFKIFRIYYTNIQKANIVAFKQINKTIREIETLTDILRNTINDIFRTIINKSFEQKIIV